MVRLTILLKNSFNFIFFIFLFFFIKIGLAQNNLAFTTLLVTATIPSKCETKASEPVFVDDDFQSIKIVSDVTVVCNNESKPIIKIISKNIKELIDNNYALHFKKNNGDLNRIYSETPW